MSHLHRVAISSNIRLTQNSELKFKSDPFQKIVDLVKCSKVQKKILKENYSKKAIYSDNRVFL